MGKLPPQPTTAHPSPLAHPPRPSAAAAPPPHISLKGGLFSGRGGCVCPKAASISDARVQCEGFNRHGVRCGATCKKSWGGLGQVLEAFLGDCLWEPWGKSCELSGGYWQLPWGVLLEICEILRRSLSLAGGISWRLLCQNPRFTEPLGVLAKSGGQIPWGFARAICLIPGEH